MAEDGAEQLMNALISKMESMDKNIQDVRAENAIMKRIMDNPQNILRKAGFVPYGTPIAEDVEADAFRRDMDTTLLKGGVRGDDKSIDKFTNEQVHEMSWDEIHEMADNQIERKEMY
jgi:hypothetical protein|tara:strand:- start:731 stop:1081 length:351 start_codon:yes stop_codon:yes gene_type:complete